MALSLSKRKRPRREDKMLKEAQLKFSERAFDDATLRTLKFLLNNGAFSSLDFPVKHGKEAAVYRATKGIGEHLAVKIFKYEGPSFQRRLKYLEGDRRFDAPRGKRDMVRIFARKEFANLKLCAEAGVPAPRPVKQRDNVVVMEFLGEGGRPSALLKDVVLEDAAGTLGSILSSMRKMFSAGLVHVDLSEFNVIIHKGRPFIIDLGQAVLAHHPEAGTFLEKDVANVLKYFRREGVNVEAERAIRYIKGGSDSYME